MKIAVIGAGGVGGYFGARLQAAGEEVVFIQRGAHGKAMQRGGLSIASPAGDIELPAVRCQADARGIGPVDVVLVTVKADGTEAAGAMAKVMLGPETIVISLQNGVENEDRLAAIVGAFAAGLVLDDTFYRSYREMRERKIEEVVAPLSAIFVPVFF